VRIATITNWAYGATVCLTIASGIVMLMASNADNVERQAVKQRQIFDQLTEDIETDAWMLSDLARLFVIKKMPSVLEEYRQKESELKNVEHRVAPLKDAGASDEELSLLQDGLTITDRLQDEQQTALTHIAQSNTQQAIDLLYGPAYEMELERAQKQIDHFRQMLDKRVIADVQAATKTSKMLRTASEVMVGLTALMFLFVLGFILKRRVLHPVVRLSDVVHRLASQDYAVETPNFNQIDEIGDMAQAIRIFRENGLARQRLEKEQPAVTHPGRTDDQKTYNQAAPGCQPPRRKRGVIIRSVPKTLCSDPLFSPLSWPETRSGKVKLVTC
jgi:HAMP domain-containing protein